MMIKKILISIFFYLFIFLTKSFSCNFNELNIDKDIKNLKIDEIFLTNQNIDKDYGKYFFPIEAFCENKYQGVIINIDTLKDKIFKINFINQIGTEKKVLDLSLKEYSVDFKFKKDNSEKKIITSEFKSKDKYYYYTHLFDEYNNLIEIFEIVDPEKNNSFRELEIKEEEQQ